MVTKRAHPRGCSVYWLAEYGGVGGDRNIGSPVHIESFSLHMLFRIQVGRVMG